MKMTAMHVSITADSAPIVTKEIDYSADSMETLLSLESVR
jgi:hypothetical protein